MSINNLKPNIELERIFSALEEIGVKKWGRNTKVAAKTGYSEPQVSAIFSGKESLTDRFLKSICANYSISEDWVRRGYGKMLLPSSADPAPVYSVTKIIEGIRPDQAELLKEWERLTDEERLLTLGVIKSMKGRVIE